MSVKELDTEAKAAVLKEAHIHTYLTKLKECPGLGMPSSCCQERTRAHGAQSPWQTQLDYVHASNTIRVHTIGD